MIQSCKSKNNNVSIVTVTYNDNHGLASTLESIANTAIHPFKVIIVDGAAAVSTIEIVYRYNSLLNIELISEGDCGIYDAMNKGRKRVTTKLVHYLNSGDTIDGDPYKLCDAPCLFPVVIIDDTCCRRWFDKIKLNGYGYCHQGVLFPSNHAEYNVELKIGADFDVVCKTFPRGLVELPIVKTGNVNYGLGGVSSQEYHKAEIELLASVAQNLSMWDGFLIRAVIYVKRLIPRFIRRRFANYFI